MPLSKGMVNPITNMRLHITRSHVGSRQLVLEVWMPHRGVIGHGLAKR